MTLEEIDGKIGELDRQRIALGEQIQALHAERNQIVNEDYIKAILQDLSPEQRDSIVKVQALHFKSDLPAAT